MFILLLNFTRSSQLIDFLPLPQTSHPPPCCKLESHPPSSASKLQLLTCCPRCSMHIVAPTISNRLAPFGIPRPLVPRHNTTEVTAKMKTERLFPGHRRWKSGAVEGRWGPNRNVNGPVFSRPRATCSPLRIAPGFGYAWASLSEAVGMVPHGPINLHKRVPSCHSSTGVRIARDQRADCILACGVSNAILASPHTFVILHRCGLYIARRSET